MIILSQTRCIILGLLSLECLLIFLLICYNAWFAGIISTGSLVACYFAPTVVFYSPTYGLKLSYWDPKLRFEGSKNFFIALYCVRLTSSSTPHRRVYIYSCLSFSFSRIQVCPANSYPRMFGTQWSIFAWSFLAVQAGHSSWQPSQISLYNYPSDHKTALFS